jgi:MerR family transcriptional regulator/heat shock protein HspR
MMDPIERRGRGRRGDRDGGDASFDEERGVFMISVAAELSGMHPQTLRMYEARGLITPKRSPKQTRLYSQADVERLRRIQRMTAEEGLNLAGVETVLEMERQLERARGELGKMRERAAELQAQMLEEVERVKRSFRAEIVPYGAYDAREVLPSGKGARPVKIAVKRTRSRHSRDGRRGKGSG